MSKNSTFACFADAAEPPAGPIELRTDAQLTIGELLEFLNEQVEKDASIKKLPVCQVERGNVTRTLLVVMDTKLNGLVFSEGIAATRFEESKTKPTVSDLIKFLNKITRTQPYIKACPVYYINYGDLSRSFSAEINVTKKWFVIDS